MLLFKKTVLLLCMLIFGVSCIYAQSDSEDFMLISHYFESFKNNDQIRSSEFEQIVQVGQENTIYISSNSSNHQLNQFGKKNTFEFISFYGRSDTSFEVDQIGNENYIQVLGENELFNKIKIIQKGSNGSLKIRNN